MHPLCCIAVDRSAARRRSPEHPPPEEGAGGGGGGPEAGVAVAGVLHKWTNYRRGWRARWFCLRDGVLSYSKIRRGVAAPPEGGGSGEVRLIGAASSRLVRGGRAPQKPAGVVNLKLSTFRESKSDERRFYILSPRKTLQLRTDSKDDRVAWIEALILARSVYSLRSLSEKISFIPNELTFSTEALRDRLHVEGLGGTLIKECEEIVLSEFSNYHKQLKFRYEEHLNLIGKCQPQSEEANVEDGATIQGNTFQLTRNDFSSSGHVKFSDYSTTESSEDVDKEDDLSNEENTIFFDADDSFSDPNSNCTSMINTPGYGDEHLKSEDNFCGPQMMDVEAECANNVPTLPCAKRRSKLPDPCEKEKSASLWSVIKDSVGKDLTRVCLPVYFNEPLSSLQKCFEELEYSYLLDEAYEYGRKGDNLMRILKVAAFAVSAYASSDGRPCKPFNPLLGETYEADYPEKGVRFFAEKISHHPMVIACHCEGKGWNFWGDSNLRSKFWGQMIQLDPIGILTLEFDDGEIFQWSKVTTSIHNLILGRLYCNHQGTMTIRGNREYSCKLKFKEQTLLDRTPRQVQGSVEDSMGNKVASLVGRWNDNMYFTNVDNIPKIKNYNQIPGASLLWRKYEPPANPTRYNLSSFAITLNELTPELQEKLPPTDSRLRPDQRYLENGEYENANAEKLRLERRQRMSSKLQENGWKPRWFEKDGEEGTYRFIGGYWEARDQKNWEGCPNIFGEFIDDDDD